ncbi:MULTISPECIES: xanthine dehydrogenase small subunit [Lonsdalea]|uniref:Xanthine dehydrogenase small subunit n=2 Tax=Lonsdalea TaxID=1082702 RepID=A0ACD1J9U0_9GAMM|nr:MULTISPECIES: xanthine dehydrogenase small subunit [Lonsdalea]RAT11831.1 xanthine dehydrogenase small subunit [Lonsdalea quercina]RAT21620.1 xanthine dehydrogenase small subunit [Lonsdalea populi]RAT22380.1 xanthine dehydrogenase small subunit [Lonsdalea populi]RAT27760.1 xanthine dehydrogenase small subunit [Lonsdalea populi]RAT34421.1 xanthine dehydrogenase small subunit [Lonsdalea populi]
MIQFLMHDARVVERDLDPAMTVLQYLRRRRRRVGTKEGCGSGDCGACTVALGRVEQGRLRYETACACLMPVSALQGKQLITVEDLRQNGKLHPAQQAVVDLHASQCGFCTPGMVMSLFVLQKQSKGWDEKAAEQALAGNLCRCTGYRPIMAAARRLCEHPIEDGFTRNEALTVAQLQALAQTGLETLAEGGRECIIPATLAQLADGYLRYPQARLLAGGTDLMLETAQTTGDRTPVIDLDQVSALRRWRADERYIHLGAGMSLTQCEHRLETLIPAFSHALRRFASRQIRNRGTLGGNVANASPIGDTPPMLLALDAELLLQRGSDTRTLPLRDFFLSYRRTALKASEFIHEILIPRGPLIDLFRAWKVSKRADDDIAIVFGAFAMQFRQGRVTEARVAFGGMDAIPRRAAHCEQALLHQPWNEATVAAACLALEQDFTPLSDARASAEYRMQVAKSLLRRYDGGLQGEADEMEAEDHVA